MKIEFDKLHNIISGITDDGKDFYISCNMQSYGYNKAKADGKLISAQETCEKILAVLKTITEG